MRMSLRRAGRRAMYVAEWQKQLDALTGKTVSDRKNSLSNLGITATVKDLLR